MILDNNDNKNKIQKIPVTKLNHTITVQFKNKFLSYILTLALD